MFRKLLCYKKSLIAAAAIALTITQAQAQCKPGKPDAPSPAAQTSVSLNGKTITIDYCTPSLRGRKLGDTIVPYGKVWRTGANTSTAIKTEADLRIGDLAVPAGTYTLYTLPEAHEWHLIVNKQVGQWGTVYDQGQDLGRVKMLDGVIPSAPVEKFEIRFEHTKGNKTELHLVWDTTNVVVPIVATN